ISLDQFSDDIEDWIIDILKKQGYTTARQVMGTNREELAQKADLEEETVDEIIRILSAEFEK
ncbi:MAG: transcription termination/antitermination protein NusA, partial [Bacteroidaceae bacterium]|nr:transcription termination/antitermination protein NusA [Bacteroidaceae bacterium]